MKTQYQVNAPAISQKYAGSEHRATFMAIAIHPFTRARPFRIGPLERI